MPDDSDTPVMDTLAVMTAASVENSNLGDRELMLVRTAALIASDAPVASYLLNIGPAAESGLTLDDVQDVLVTVAPIVGTSRVVTGAANIARALGIVVLTAAEMDADAGEDD